MYEKRKALLLVVLTYVIYASLVGCAAPALQQVETEALLPEIDVVQVKENSDEALKIAQEAKLEVEAVNPKIMELNNRIIALDEEVSGVSIAKIEEIENRMALLIEAYKDLQAQISAIVVLPQVQIKKNQKKVRKKQPATFSPASASNILTPTSEYESYHAALRVFNSRNYDQAITLFKETLDKYPKGTYADNCVYWIGESYYAKGDYASAIAAFKRVFTYANTSKADDAQLKLGLSYHKLGQYGAAKEAFTRLVNRYPASEYVPKAKKYLQDMQ